MDIGEGFVFGVDGEDDERVGCVGWLECWREIGGG